MQVILTHSKNFTIYLRVKFEEVKTEISKSTTETLQTL